MRPSSDRFARLGLGCAGWLAGLLVAAPLPAQIVYPGDTRVEMSDVTGPPLTSGDLFGPGTVRSFSCPVAWGVRTVADRTRESLRGAAGLPVAGGTRLSEPMREDLLRILTDGAGDDEASARLIAALSGGNSPEAAAAAKGLVERLNGLLRNAGRLRPERPGYRTATQLAGAVGAYNTYIDRSTAAFLGAPPEALLGVQAVLSPLLIAALENEGRPASRRTSDDGLACAAPAPELVPSRPAPPERPVVICVMAADGLRAIGAIALASGDTVVAVAGQRIPLARAYAPPTAYAADAPWYAREEVIEVNGRRYVRYGLPRLAATDAVLRRVGEYQGVPLYASPDADALVVPLDRGCMVHDYRPEVDLRPRG